MKKSRFNEVQIIGMIKEQEAGMPTAEVCRRHGLSLASFYKFKSKYGVMNVSETIDTGHWKTRTPSLSVCWLTQCSTMPSEQRAAVRKAMRT